MDQKAGEDYELLDNVTDTDVNRRPPRRLPPLELGHVAAVTEPPERPPIRGARWWSVALAFVLGVVAGAYVWHVQEESAAEAEAAQRTDLVAAAILGTPDGGRPTQHLRVLLYNNGPLELDILAVHPRGWTAHGTDTGVVAPDEWAVLRMLVEPDCDAPVPRELLVEVRTAAGILDVTIPIPPGENVLDAVHNRICGIGARYALSPGRVTQLPADDDALHMRLELRSLPPDVDFEIVSVAAATAGFVAEPTNLPVEFHATRRSPSQLDLRWEVTGCYLTDMLGDIVIQVRILEPEGETYPAQVTLPGQAVAMMARHAAETCG